MLNSKQLHLHSVPLLVFSAMSMVAVMALALSTVPVKQNDVLSALIHPALTIGASDQSTAAAQAIETDRTVLSGLGSTGERMAVQLSASQHSLFMR